MFILMQRTDAEPILCICILLLLLEADSDSHTDSYTMQDFSTGSDSDSDILIEMYVIGTEISPWDADPSLKWVQ